MARLDIEKEKKRLEDIDKEIEQSADKDVQYLGIMFRDISRLDTVLPELNEANKKEFDDVRKKLRDYDKHGSRETRHLHKFIKKTLQPFRHMISVARKEKKYLESLISKKKRQLENLDKAASRHKVIQKLYKRDSVIKSIQEAKEKAHQLENYIQEAERMFSSENAIEQRLTVYASRGGKLDKDLGILTRDMGSLQPGSGEGASKLNQESQNIREDLERIKDSEHGLYSFSEKLKTFTKKFRVAIFAVMMGIQVLNPAFVSGQESHQQGSQETQITEQQQDVIEHRSENLNNFYQRHYHEGEVGESTKPGVYFVSDDRQDPSGDKIFVVMDFGSTPRRQYEFRMSMKLLSELQKSNVILKNVSLNRAYDFHIENMFQRTGNVNRVVASMSREFLESEIFMASLRSEIAMHD